MPFFKRKKQDPLNTSSTEAMTQVLECFGTVLEKDVELDKRGGRLPTHRVLPWVLFELESGQEVRLEVPEMTLFQAISVGERCLLVAEGKMLLDFGDRAGAMILESGEPALIEPMDERDYEQLITLDMACFDRPFPRSVENVRTLHRRSDSESYVLRDGERLIGYVFTHRCGSSAFLGPLGVDASYRKRGLGKLLVRYAREALLSDGCWTVGLEAMPDKIYNIGLYGSLGFQYTAPTLLLSPGPDCCFPSWEPVDSTAIDYFFIEKFFQDMEKRSAGCSLESDVKWALEHHAADLMFYQIKQDIKGFLCYTPNLCRDVWGAFMDEQFREPFLALFGALQRRHPDIPLKVRVNSGYKKVTQLLERDFRLEGFSVRLEDGAPVPTEFYENSILFRAWMA